MCSIAEMGGRGLVDGLVEGLSEVLKADKGAGRWRERGGGPCWGVSNQSIFWDSLFYLLVFCIRLTKT
jgi:hypothetical protein